MNRGAPPAGPWPDVLARVVVGGCSGALLGAIGGLPLAQWLDAGRDDTGIAVGVLHLGIAGLSAVLSALWFAADCPGWPWRRRRRNRRS